MIQVDDTNYAAYRIKAKYWDRQTWANGVDLDQTPQTASSHQSLQFLPLNQ